MTNTNATITTAIPRLIQKWLKVVDDRSPGAA